MILMASKKKNWRQIREEQDVSKREAKEFMHPRRFKSKHRRKHGGQK
jgi:hypothetical protein